MKETPEKSAHILLVDDQAANLQLLGRILQRDAYTFGFAVDAESAWKSIEERLPDLILLDIMMPGTDGYEFCRILKEHPRTRPIPIIFLSAKNESEDIVRGFQVGAVDYIAKPFAPDEVVARVTNHLQLRRTREQLQTYSRHLEEMVYERTKKLRHLNEKLEILVEKRTGSLRQSEEKYRMLFESSPDPILILDEGRVTDCNPQTLELFHIARDRFVGRMIEDFILQDETGQNTSPKMLLNRNKLSEKLVSFETRMKDTSGRPFLVEVKAQEVHFPDRDRIFVRIRDITDIRRNEQALQQLASIVEYSQDAIFSMTLDGKILSWNTSAVRLYGYKAEEIIGRHLSLLCDPSAPLKIGEMLKHIAAGNAIQGLEVIRRCSNGTLVPVLQTISPIRDQTGEIVAASSIDRDITIRKRAEEALHRSKRKTDQLNIQLQEAIKKANQLAAEADQANQTKSRFLASMSHEIRTPMNSIMGFTEILLETETDPFKIERLKLIHDASVHLLSIINDILDHSKIEEGKMSLDLVDFPVRKLIQSLENMIHVKAEEKGLQLNFHIDTDVPHILRGDSQRIRQVLLNLLSNAVKFTSKGYVELHARWIGNEIHFVIRDSGKGISKEHLEEIFQPFHQGERQVSRLFGGTGLGLSISRQLVALMSGRIEVTSEQGIGSEFRVVLPLPAMKPDAADEQPPNGELLVSKWLARCKEDEDEEDYEDIEETFYLALELLPGKIEQLQAVVKEGNWEEIRRIAHSLKGTMAQVCITEISEAARDIEMEVKNERRMEHVQTSMERILGLFRCIPAGCKQQETRSPTSPDQKESSLRILVAEDSMVNRKVMRDYLKRLGYQCDFAEDGVIAMEKLAGSHYDILFLDVQMPNMDGMEVLQKVRENAALNSIWVVILTAYAMNTDRNRFYDAGCDDYLAKPISKKMLKQAIERYCKEKTRE